jgi:hypothetical protein
MINPEPVIGGHKYQIGQLNAMQQFHVSRRIAPLLATMGISFATILQHRSIDVDQLMPVLGPVSQVLSTMSDEQTDYIFATCLGVVKRAEKGPGGKDMWAPVSTGAALQYEDIKMQHMIAIVVAVLQVNLEDFFKELLAQVESRSSSASPEAPAA